MSDVLAPGSVVQGMNGQYRVLNEVGRGGMGVVYRVERVSDTTTWALKEMRPAGHIDPQELAENRRLFAEEAQLLQRLSHPNIPQVIDYFENNGRPTMVMEFINGKELEALQRQMNAPFTSQEAVKLVHQIAQVLQYLHSQTPPIIFRDMKPSNIMVTNDGVVKLVDFGVARTFKAHKQKDTVAMGSPGYAPPEQYGKGQTDARSDIYALAATLLHLLTNLPPVPLQTPKPGQIIRFNPTVDTDLEQIVIRGMSLRQEDRQQTAAEFEQALRPYLPPDTQQSSAAVPAPSAPAVPPIPAAPPVPNPVPAAQPVPQQPGLPAPVVPPIDGVACEQCGRINRSNARFCSSCGAQLQLQRKPSAKLIITSPRGVWEYQLEHLPCHIGRRDPAQQHHPELDLAEHDRGIASRRHAVIEQLSGSYRLVDQGSVNGTTVNGIPLSPHQPYVLRQGDRIKIGEVEMVFSQ